MLSTAPSVHSAIRARKVHDEEVERPKRQKRTGPRAKRSGPATASARGSKEAGCSAPDLRPLAKGTAEAKNTMLRRSTARASMGTHDSMARHRCQ
jgi:hypothetical protein